MNDVDRCLICGEVIPEGSQVCTACRNKYDIVTGELKPFSTDIVITNKIPWNYDPDAYNELADSTLNKLACGDATIRALLEECIGYCRLFCL